MRVQRTFMLDSEVVEAYEEHCKKHDKSYSEFVREALKRYLKDLGLMEE